MQVLTLQENFINSLVDIIHTVKKKQGVYSNMSIHKILFNVVGNNVGLFIDYFVYVSDTRTWLGVGFRDLNERICILQKSN